MSSQYINPQEYFPPPDSAGGWRTLTDTGEILQNTGMEKHKLDEAFKFIKSTSKTKNGGLLVVRNGWLVYEDYFGKGHREATPNLASCGKSFTSIAMGILMKEKPWLFPDGLDQKVYTPEYLPAEIFPLSDPRMADIKLGHLLEFTAGIRGNNPAVIYGKDTLIDPVGPDGWISGIDEYALGLREGVFPNKNVPFSTKTLWCDPGGGFSYASASIHVVSVILRHITGMELENYIEINIARPLGWGLWGYGYKNQPLLTHTHGAGGIALRSTDVLRFCYLLLREGRWNQQQIVPKDYIHHASKASRFNPHTPYSLQFHVNTDGHIPELPEDAFWKGGSGGHWFWIIPSLDLIIWNPGGRNEQYSTANTGLSEPPFSEQMNEPASSGKSSDDYPDYIKTAILVVKSIRDAKTGCRPMTGQIIIDPDNPGKMVYNKDENTDGKLDPLFLCGPGDPEGFLYRGKRNPDGTRKGDQMKLIRKLKKHGGNSIYLQAVRTHGGDAKTDRKNEPKIYPDDMHNPWIDQDPKKGLNENILNQWDIWFEEMDKNGIVIYFFIYDDQINVTRQLGWPLDESGELHVEEKEFVQAIVRRFKHHKHLIWCVMEEGQEIGLNWQRHISKIAEAIREADEYCHIITAHQLRGNVFYHADDPVINQFALQTDKFKVSTVDSLYQFLLQAWKNSENRYSIVMSEDYVHGNVLIPEKNREETRKRNWAAAMSGSYIMVLGMDIRQTQKKWLKDCRIIQTFFENTNFNQMHPDVSLVSGETVYILAHKGFDYILYSSHSGKGLGINDIPGGVYSFTWLDCVSGKTKEITDTITTERKNYFREKPSGFGKEVALYIERKDKRPEEAGRQIPETFYTEKGDTLPNIAPLAENRSITINRNTEVYIQLDYEDPDGGPGPYTIKITSLPNHGALSGAGNDLYYLPDRGYTGNDRFLWKVNDGKDDSEEVDFFFIIR